MDQDKLNLLGSHSNMFGFGKSKAHESFPSDWLLPGETNWPGSGLVLLLGPRWRKIGRFICSNFSNAKDFTTLIAWCRKNVLRKKAIFWMENEETIKKYGIKLPKKEKVV